MILEKEARVGGVPSVETVAPDDRTMEEINALALSPLEAEEVFAFAVRLCDNEVDRDRERFTIPALGELAKLFQGKPGLFDHSWTAEGQAARIYRTAVITDEGKTTSAGEPYTWLKAWAYMVRTEDNASLIREIQGGIKKEVSVSCAVGESRCSICGEDLRTSDTCPHVKGREYGGRLCYGILDRPTDAYEWSFVAVPAQPQAGVTKGYEQHGLTLKALAQAQPSLAEELEALETQAELGRRYLKALRREVVTLGGLLSPELDRALRERMAERLEEPELLALKKDYQARLEEKYPPVSQLYRQKVPSPREETDKAFLI